MNFENMELDELKKLAKNTGIRVGNLGKEKLIEKLKEKNIAQSVISTDVDLAENIEVVKNKLDTNEMTQCSLLDSITSTIDELDEFTAENDDYKDTLKLTDTIPVKSITFGGLTFKSRINNVVFRWNQIGAIQYMTISDLNEMNTYSSDFLNNPLVILMDERAIKKFRLTPVYENVAKINNLTQVFNSDLNTIAKVIDDALRVNMRDILISKVQQMYKTKKLVDINILRLLQNKLKFDIMDIE